MGRGGAGHAGGGARGAAVALWFDRGGEGRRCVRWGSDAWGLWSPDRVSFGRFANSFVFV